MVERIKIKKKTLNEDYEGIQTKFETFLSQIKIKVIENLSKSFLNAHNKLYSFLTISVYIVA